MQLCSKCGRAKPTTDFVRARRQCKDCRRAVARARYAADPERFRREMRDRRRVNPERYRATEKRYYATHREDRRSQRLEKHRRYNATHRKEIRQRRQLAQAYVDAARAGGCVDCGVKHLGVLDSDHVRGVKVNNIATLVRDGPTPALFAELAKCETRCANCHRIVTAQRARNKALARAA